MNFKESFITLESGLRIRLTEAPDRYSAYFGVYFLTGSEDEKDENGISHLLEHMLFKSTKNYTEEEIAYEFYKISAKHNAYTAQEFTKYYCSVPRDNLARAAELISEMVFEAKFDEKELENEKKVISEELLTSMDSQSKIAAHAFIRYAYKGTGLSNIILGELEKMKKVTTEELIDYRNNHYNAKNCVISVIGDFKMEDIELLVKNLFDNKFVKQKNEVVKEFTESQNYSSKRIDIPMQRNQVLGNLYYKNILKKDDQPKVKIIASIIGGSPNSRLFKTIRNELALVYAVDSVLSNNCNNSVFGVSFRTSKENLDQATQKIKEIVQDVWENGVTNEEFVAQKDLAISRTLMSMDNPTSSTKRLIYRNELLDIQTELDNLKTFTKEECEEAFRDNVQINNLVEVFVGPHVSETSIDKE